MNRVRLPAIVAVVGGDAGLLWALRRAPTEALRGLGDARSWFAADGADRAVATLAEAAIWLVAAWVGLGLLCCLAARLPGVAGAAAASAGSVLLPRLLVRLVAGSVGLGVLVAPVAAGAHPPPRPAPTSAAALPGPAWPSHSSAPTVSGPRWPSGAGHDRPATSTDHPATHAIHTTHRRPAANEPAPDHAASANRHSDPVRVQPGDSLWLLAAQRLGPRATDAQIAAEWPRWYATNRAVVGPDPDLIVPGQVLHVPAASQQENR